MSNALGNKLVDIMPEINLAEQKKAGE